MRVRHHCFGEIPVGELGELVNGEWRKVRKRKEVKL